MISIVPHAPIPPRQAICVGLLIWSCAVGAMAGPARFTPRDFADAERINKLLKEKREKEVLPMLGSALRRHEQILGRDHKDTISLVVLFAALERDFGNKDKAIALFEKALAAQDRTVGTKSPASLSTLENLVVLYFQAASYAKSASTCRRLLDLQERTLGESHPDTLRSASNLATALSKMTKYAEAAALFERVLLFDRQRSPESADIAGTLVQLGVCYRELGKTGKAEEYFLEALRVREKVFGKNSEEAKEVSGYLGVLYAQQGDTDRALQLLGKLTGTGPAQVEETAETAKALNNMAVAYQKAGDYAKAESLSQQALAIVERIKGKEHPDTASALNNVASLKMALGQKKDAEPLFERALAIQEKALGPNHPSVGDGLTNLATLYVENGAMEKAKALFERALRIYEKAYGGQHDRVITCLNNLGETYGRNNERDKAKIYFHRALSASEAANGLDHISSAVILNNLGTLYFTMGEPQAALPFLRRALRVYAKTFGDLHPTTVSILENLSLIEFRCGHTAEFDALVDRADKGLESILTNVLSFSSEEERLSWHYQHSPLTLFALKPHPAEFARSVFRYKGIVLDSIIEDHVIAANAEPTARSALETLRTSKQALWQATLATTNGATAEDKQSLAAAREKVREVEKTLARKFAAYGHTRRALEVEVAQIKAALPTGVVLVDIVRYIHYLVGSVDGELRYVAVVLPSQGELRLVPLGKAEAVDKLVELFQKSIRGATDDETGRTSIQKLHEHVWMPIERALPPKTARVIVSPDAQLCFVPFAALRGIDDKFVCENYQLDYVASGRDVLTKTKRQDRPSSLILANPAFAAVTAKEDVSKRAVPGAIELREMHFAPLPGAEREGRLLSAEFEKAGLDPQLLSGADATETRLRSVHSPRLLHLATHGFFVAGHNKTPAQAAANSMQRSGVALAGAETTLGEWRHGRTPSTDNDGILTSEEISTLNLEGTWLVTLSACDTGSGDAQYGEGIMGMRRGFSQAGTQNLLMTLWPISDEATVDIMLDFYARAAANGDAPKAWADTQRDWLVKLRQERGLLDAVRLAGPFVLSWQGGQ